MSYKRILVAVDGSKTSRLAFNEALQLAKALQAKLCIVHVIEKLPDHIAFAIDVVKYQMLANKKSELLLKKFHALAVKNKISTDIKLIEILDFKESISKKILQTVKSWRANLLVMGTHGRTGVSRMMLGSVAEETLKTSTIPILLIRGKEK